MILPSFIQSQPLRNLTLTQPTFRKRCRLSCGLAAPNVLNKIHKVSRRALLAFVAAAYVSAQTCITPEWSLAASSAHLLDKDFRPEATHEPSDWDQPPFTPKPLDHEELFSHPESGAATYDDYVRALKIPPVDLGRAMRHHILTAFFVFSPFAVLTTISAFNYRMSPRITLPTTYDVYAIKRYFQLRPDVVLRRLAQFAGEATSLAIGIWCDSIRDSIDSIPQHLRIQTATWRNVRTRKRAQKRAVVLRDAITRLGPAMIKLGQAAASRPDLLTAPVVRELQPLQDDVLGYFPSEEAFAVIEDQLGASVTAIFDNIDPHPVAGASLGMVFKAHVDGIAVAVKVQRPEVAASVALDCYIIRWMAIIATVLFGLRTDLRAAVDEYASRLFEELDYTNELSNMTKFRDLYAHIDGIYLPRAFPQYCSRRVLVTEWIDGEKLIDEQARVRSEDLGLVETGIRFALVQLLDKGFLHADMHNGNMLRTRSGYLAYIDFGLVSEVPQCVRESMVCALVHLIHGEYTLLAESFSGLELMRSDDVEVELPVLAEALREAFEPNEGTCDRETRGVRRFRDFTLIGVATKLLMLGTRFPFVFRDYFLNNLRCLGMLEGLALNADPNFSILSVVYPYVAKKILVESSARYLSALESLVIDSYGRMRWARVDQMLNDVQAAAASAKIGPVDSVLNSVATIPKSLRRAQAFATDALDGIVVNESERNARMVLDFITSDTGRFLRRYVVQRYLLNVELSWRKRIDNTIKITSASGDVVPSPMPLVNATSAISRKAAKRLLALPPTARELSDDEARLRTRDFFRSTRFIKKVQVLLRLFPKAIVPWFQTMLGLTAYALTRLWKSLFKPRQGDKVMQPQSSTYSTRLKIFDNPPQSSQNNGNYASNDEHKFLSSNGIDKMQTDGRKWRAFESSFARRTRDVQLSGRRVVSNVKLKARPKV